MQQDYQELKIERDELKTTCENLKTERDKLQSKFGELETQRATMEETKEQVHVKAAAFKGQIASLAASLKEAKEQQTSIQPFKEHALTQRSKMHWLQVSIEEEKCKVL